VIAEVADVGRGWVKRRVLSTFPPASVDRSSVTVGMYVVDTTTFPGYTNLVAVTSIWHSLPHEADGLGNDEARLGDETALGPMVWISVRVVGTTCVMVSI
jgi:hypothetical protein